MTTEPASAAEEPRAVQLVCVDPARVHEIWPHMAPLIGRAILNGGFGDCAALERDLLGRRALLWLAWDGEEILAALVTEIALFHGLKVCTIAACGGHGVVRIRHLVDEIERYARAERCSRIRVYGRRGWARVLS